MHTREIPAPTTGRVVLYAPDKSLDAVLAQAEPGADDSEIKTYPATVIRHRGDGVVQIAVCGFTGTFTASWGETEPGEPALGCWCWPIMSRETISVSE